MVRRDDGTWTVTIPPQGVGFHYYYFIIDGVRVSDPASETFFGSGSDASGIEIPEAGVTYSSVQDVPHGVVRNQRYFSKVTGEWRRCFVYTPPGYDNSGKIRYPVLYIMHGGGEDERGAGTLPQRRQGARRRRLRHDAVRGVVHGLIRQPVGFTVLLAKHVPNRK